MYPETVKSYTSESEEQALIVLQKTRGKQSIFSLCGGLSIPLVSLAASLIPPSLDVAEYERAVIIKIVQESLASHLVCPNDPSTTAVESNRLCGNYLTREMPCVDGWDSGWELGWFSMFSVRHSSSLKYFSSACRAISPSPLVGFASSIAPHPTLGARSGDPCAEGNAAGTEGSALGVTSVPHFCFIRTGTVMTPSKIPPGLSKN